MNNKILYSLLAVSPSFLAQGAEVPMASEEEIERIQVSQMWQPYRGNVPLVETPQAVDTISADVLENEGITHLMEALEFSPSVVRQNNSGGLFDSFAMRGFSGDENNPSGYLVNGFNSRGYNGNRSTANVETIEVMKGPGSALYGQGEPGGTVNIITKKPQFDEQGYLQGTVGNNDKKQLEFDYTNGLNDDVAFRINGAYEDSDSYRDHVYLEALHLNPSLLWNISDVTSVSYEMEILDQKKPWDRGVYVLDNDFDATNPEDFYGDPRDGAHQVKALGHQLLLNHSLTDDWHLLAGLAYRESSMDGTSSDTELSDGRQLIYDDPNTLSRQRRVRDYDAQDFSARFELSGELTIANITNNLLFGLDYYQYDLDTDYKRWRTAWGSGDPTYSIDPNNPDYTQPQPEATQNKLTEETQTGLGFYAQDLLELTERTKLLLGFRVDKIEKDLVNKLDNTEQSDDQTQVTPRIGLTYKMADNLVLYTSYAEGFRPNSGIDSSGNSFEPEETKSFEFGAKWDDVLERFSGSIALFDAEKSNLLTLNPGTGQSDTLGEVESQGIEFDLVTELGYNTRIELAYAYTDAKTKNEATNLDWGTVIPAGSRLINVAEHVGHLSLRHDTELMGKPTYLGTTVHYVGDRLGETTDPDYILPSYTIVNLGAVVEMSDQLTLKLDVNNLFDEEYFVNSYHKLWTMPGAPMNYTVSVKYSF